MGVPRVRRLHLLLSVCALVGLLSVPVEAQQTIGGERLRIFDDSLLSGDVGHPDYLSQLARWNITPEGGADFRYLFSDELHVRSFVADLEQALAGGQIISKSVAVLAANFTVPAGGAANTITVRDLPSAENMAVFETGDTIRLRSFSRAAGSLTVADAYGVVTGYSDQPAGVQTWTFTRNTGADGGSMSDSTVIQADAIVLDYGTSGNGFHEVNAIDGLYGLNSPYSQVVTWNTSPIAANLTVRSRIGNLRGVTGVAGEYGAILGTYAATDGQYVRVSNQAVELHGVNMQLWDGPTNVIRLDRTAPSFAIGSPVPSSYGSGTGIWMGNDGGIYRFRVGNPAGNRMTWDGSTLQIVGTIQALSGTIGGWVIGSTALTGGAATLSSTGNLTLGSGSNVVRLSADNATHRLWVGNATAGSAPFRVTTTGGFTATNANITGTINAGGGDVVIDSTGIQIDAGLGATNAIRWTGSEGGARVFGANSLGSPALFLQGGGGGIVLFGSNFGSLVLDNNALTGGNNNLGTSTSRWNELWLTEELFWTSPPTTDFDDYPVVYSTGNTKLYRKTDGFNGTLCNGSAGVESITVERGIVVGATCF